MLNILTTNDEGFVMSSCFFIGHREADENIVPALAGAIERHICDFGVSEFIVGCYGAFDRMAAHQLSLAKMRYPHISLLLLSAYHPSERKIHLPEGFDSAFYPLGLEKVPKRFAIVRANKYMVKRCEYLIAYVWRTASNAGNLLEYAEKLREQGKMHIENLAESICNKDFYSPLK